MSGPDILGSVAYRRYVLTALTLIYTLNTLDGGLMILLLQPIKLDLGLSDSQLGFLTGIAFAIFYATLGLPIARWADRGNRSTIAAMAIGLWGITVMLCILVRNFPQLIAARIAAGIGEAGCLPPTYSLIGDYFPGGSERTQAMTIYMLANPLSALLSFGLGGWLNEHYGWRATFFVMGTPALLIAPIIKWTVRDPRQTGGMNIGQRPLPKPRMGAALQALWNTRSSRHLSIALIVLYTMGAGLGPWYAAFMMRSHGMSTQELGVWMGIIVGVSACAGIGLGGFISARCFSNDERRQMRFSAVTMALVVPCFLAFLLAREKSLALVAFAPLMLVFNVFNAPTFALLQRLVQPGIRATAFAMVMLLANLIGMGLGPQVVGVLSDWMRPRFGNESLRYAMLVTSFLALWAAYHFWKVGRTVAADLRAAANAPSSA